MTGSALHRRQGGDDPSPAHALTLLNKPGATWWPTGDLHATITPDVTRRASNLADATVGLPSCDAFRGHSRPGRRLLGPLPRGILMNAEVRTVRAHLTAFRPADWSERIAKTLLALALASGVLWALAQGGLSAPVDLAQLFG